MKARLDGEFLSKEDLQQRGKVSKTIIEYMDAMGCLEGLTRRQSVVLYFRTSFARVKVIKYG